jgi:hypothetical protein
MRRRGENEAAAKFYGEYAAKDDVFYDKYYHAKSHSTRTFLEHIIQWILRLFELFKSIIALLGSKIMNIDHFLRLQIPNRENIDVVSGCTDCGKLFSLLSLWRYPCACCENIFCRRCLSLTHALHDGKHKGASNTKRNVCSYCYFQLCARHCNASCCQHLKVRDLRRFLSRKGISMFGALEKSDLINGVKQWALDLSVMETRELFKQQDHDTV